MANNSRLDTLQRLVAASNSQIIQSAFRSLMVEPRAGNNPKELDKLCFDFEGQLLRSARNAKIVNYTEDLAKVLKQKNGETQFAKELQAIRDLIKTPQLQQIAESNQPGATREAIEAARELLKSKPELLEKRARCVFLERLEQLAGQFHQGITPSETTLRQVISSIQKADTNLPSFFKKVPSRVQQLTAKEKQTSPKLLATAGKEKVISKKPVTKNATVAKRQAGRVPNEALKKLADTKKEKAPRVLVPVSKGEAISKKPAAKAAKPVSRQTGNAHIEAPQIPLVADNNVLKKASAAPKLCKAQPKVLPQTQELAMLNRLVGPLSGTVAEQLKSLAKASSKCQEIAKHSSSFGAAYAQSGGLSGLLIKKVKTAFGRKEPSLPEQIKSLSQDTSNGGKAFATAFSNFKRAVDRKDVKGANSALNAFLSSYGKLIESQARLAEKLAEIQAKSKPGSVLSTIANDAFNVLSFAGVGMLAKAAKTVGGIGLKEAGILLVAQFTKASFKRAILCSLGFAVPTALLEGKKTKEFNDSLTLFRKDPNRAITKMTSLLGTIEKEIKHGNASVPKVLTENLTTAKSNLAKLKTQLSLNKDLNTKNVASTFVQIFATCMLFETAFGVLRAAPEASMARPTKPTKTPKPAPSNKAQITAAPTPRRANAPSTAKKSIARLAAVIATVTASVEGAGKRAAASISRVSEEAAARLRTAGEAARTRLKQVNEGRGKRKETHGTSKADSHARTQGAEVPRPVGFQALENPGIVTARDPRGIVVDHGPLCATAVKSKEKRFPCQDHVLATNGSNGHTVLGVFDGMGGGPNGAKASLVAAGHVKDAAETGTSLSEAIERAHLELRRTGDGRGTTACVAEIFPDGRLQLSNVGDCSAFRIRRDGTVERLVEEDASFRKLVPPKYSGREWYDNLAALAEKARKGDREALTAFDIYQNKRNVISQTLGGPQMDIAQITTRLEPGDTLVMVSDGAGDVLSTDRFSAIVGKGRKPLDIANDIMREAARRNQSQYAEVILPNGKIEGFVGKSDDITALVYRY